MNHLAATLRTGVLLVAVLIPAVVDGAETNSPPNLVVILVDDLRWDELGCTGHPFARTPAIDRVAREGARFRNAFCTTPLCSPVRATLLTGLHTHRHGILDNTERSPQTHKLPTFFPVLQQAGYETAFVGKWHMGNDDTPRPGIDHWVALAGQGTSFDPMLNVNGTQKAHTGHTTDVLNDYAAAFVRQPHKGPFCLYVSHKALHPETIQNADGSLSDPGASGFHPAERHKELYADEPITRRLSALDVVDDKPALAREVEGLPPLGPATGTDDKTIRDRQRMLVGVDEGVGMLFDALDETGVLDETVFIFTSDHGYWYGEHGLSVERRLAYEEAIRVPLLVRYPPLVTPGRLIDDWALSIDLAPTLCDLAGAPPMNDIDGRSLAPLLVGRRPADWRTSFLIQYNSDIVFPRTRNMGYRAVRTGRWKYIRYTDLAEMDELYDLLADPSELTNIINDPGSTPIVQDLSAELDRLLAN